MGPERSQLLQILPSLTARQFFSISAYFCLCGRLRFVDAYILLTPSFYMRQYFVDANNLSTPKFMLAPIFLYILPVTIFLYILPAPIFLCAPIICWRQYFRVFFKDDCCSNDYVLCIS